MNLLTNELNALLKHFTILSENAEEEGLILQTKYLSNININKTDKTERYQEGHYFGKSTAYAEAASEIKSTLENLEGDK